MSDFTPAAITSDLGRFVAGFTEAPAAALAVACTGIVDAIGLILAARAEPVVQAVRRVAGGTETPAAASGGVSVLFSRERMRAVDAAMVNATAAHAFAMDDVAWGCHPSAMLLPALLACGEQRGSSGPEVLRAWVVGYEVLAELASREPDSLHPTGWHPSGLLGPIAVAAAVCNLRRLPAETVVRALGIAASMTGGVSVNFGTQTKAIHAGRVAQAGILAADLAEQGVTAAADALERPTGFLRTISPCGRVDILRPVELGPDHLRVLTAGISIKKYPLCYSVHRITDAGIDISHGAGFRADDVAHIAISVGRRQAEMARHIQPQTALEARYSVPFAVASGLLASAAGFAQLDAGFFQSDAVRRLIDRTQVDLLNDVSTDDPVFSQTDRVRVTLADGRVLDSGEVRFARGHASLPVSPAQLRAKFVDCALAGGISDADALYQRLQAFESLADVADIARYCLV